MDKKPHQDDRNLLVRIFENLWAGLLWIFLGMLLIGVIFIFFWIASFAGGSTGFGWIFVFLAIIATIYALVKK